MGAQAPTADHNPLHWRRIGHVICFGAGFLLVASSASTRPFDRGDPLRFFDGSTESVSTTKIALQKPFVTRSVGRGKIASDGALDLVQHVDEQGRRHFDRVWHIREIAPGHFGGTMSEAAGPVTIERTGAGYLFRFTLKNDLSVEEWLIPQSDSVAGMRLTVRKFGVAVVHSQGWVRRVG